MVRSIPPTPVQVLCRKSTADDRAAESSFLPVTHLAKTNTTAMMMASSQPPPAGANIITPSTAATTNSTAISRRMHQRPALPMLPARKLPIFIPKDGDAKGEDAADQLPYLPLTLNPRDIQKPTRLKQRQSGLVRPEDFLPRRQGFATIPAPVKRSRKIDSVEYIEPDNDLLPFLPDHSSGGTVQLSRRKSVRVNLFH